jgi:ankyrin repeat protein
MMAQHTIQELYQVRGSSGRGLLHYCVRRGADYLGLLVSAGWPVYKEGGWTPQHEAALIGDLASLRLLKEGGAALSAKEPLNGGTPLHVAAFNGHLSVVKYLIAAGVDVNARDKEGWTALSQARDQGFPEIIDWLKQHGATR